MFPETTNPSLVEREAEKATVVNRKAALALLHDFPRLDLKAALAAAKKPVRCINAAAPRAAPPTAIETNRKYADYRAVLMEGVGHYPMLEQPAEFNHRLREMLTAVFN